MASTHKHLRSSTADKRPTTAIAEGQLAVNTNATSPGLFFKDSTGATIIKVGPVHVGTTAPNAVPPTGGSSGNSSGEVWLDISLTPPGVKIWDGSAWVNATPAGSTTVQGLLELATNAETQAGSDAIRAVTPAGLQSKVSDSTSTASSTTIASSAAVKIAYDLANAALPKSGGTVTGNLEIGTTGTLTFEGSTADGFETTLAAADPTADRTITLPNTTGTVITTGDTGTVTSTMIADGTIVNADINASAAIAPSKLGGGALPNGVTVSSANIVDGTIVNADINASAAIAGSKISPDFAGQNVVTTGSVTGASLIPTSSTVPTNGLYLPAANNVALSTNGTGQVFVTSNGNAGIGTVSASNVAGKLHLRADGDEYKSLLVLQNRNTGGSVGGAINFVNGGVDLSDDRYSYIRGIVTGAGQNGNHLVFGTNANGQASSERLRITSAGLVGIGTSSPGAQLEVANTGIIRGSASGDNTYPQYQLRRTGSTTFTDSNWTTFISSNGSLQIKDETAAADRLTITTGGNVGIGTTNPQATLDVQGIAKISTPDAASVSVELGSGATGDRSTFIDFVGDTTYTDYGLRVIRNPGANGGSTLATRGTGALTFQGIESSPFVFVHGPSTERARIDSSGRLLVGTSSALSVANITAGLELHSTATNNGASLSVARFNNDFSGPQINLAKSRNSTIAAGTIVQSNDELGSIYFAGDDGSDLNSLAARIQAFVDGTPGANDMPGRLVFSTTADGASSPTERMIIYSDGRIAAYSGNGTPYILSSIRTAGSSDRIISLRHSATSMLSATESLTVRTNGNVENTNNSYGALSDIKLKENIVDANSQWDDIKALQVRNYNFKEGQTHTQIGLIAQEVELVSPGLVSESPDRDEDGNDLGTVTKSVNYSVLYMKAVKALQEAMERIETLEQRLNDAGIN